MSLKVVVNCDGQCGETSCEDVDQIKTALSVIASDLGEALEDENRNQNSLEMAMGAAKCFIDELID